MIIEIERRIRRWLRDAVSACTFALVCAWVATPSLGVDLLSREDIKLTWDTTLGYGVLVRVEDRDPRLIGVVNLGEAFSVNADDGNINYDKGMASNLFKLTSEIDFSYKDWFGVFVRGRSFYDLENEDNPRVRFQLTDAALDRVGYRTELLDYFTWFRFDLGKVPFEFRVGDQVISWGESTFIPNGINVINPVDVSALRSPGAELREAFLPIGAASLSFAPSDGTAVEMFYQYRWDDTKIDPPGTYFSTADFAGEGAEKVFLGFAAVSDFGTFLPAGLGGFDPNFLAVLRQPDREPDDGGQYGVALRVFAPRLGGSEFGFYYLNYHSRLPVISGTSGTAPARATANQAFAFLARFVGPQLASAVATDIFGKSSGYFLEYPEDIKLYGISFNTQIGDTALQGEISQRADAPLQIDDAELLFAALSPVTFNLAFRDNQLGTFEPSVDIHGYIRRDVSQAQLTVTRILGPILGADTSVIVGEAALSRVHDMPDKSVLRLEGPGTFTSGNPRQATAPGVFFPLGGAHTAKPEEPADAFADENSYGYRLAGRLEYLNALGAMNLVPRFSWQHDVSGTSPGPGGTFIEDRKAMTLGVSGTYQNSWEVDISYTSFFGGNRYNLINDRDFVAINMKYSF